MSTPFVAEIRMFAGSFAPKGNAFCNGQLIAISQNTALFSLLGTTYGGDGRSTFGLPNLQGRAAIGSGQGAGLSPRTLGAVGGEANVTLLQAEMAMHNHSANGVAAAGDSQTPGGAVWSAAGAGRTPPPAYASAANTNMSANTLGQTGGSQPHNNMPPYQAVSFIIALVGVFPPRN